MTMERAAVDFSASELRAEVAALAVNESLPPHALADYRAFYGFNSVDAANELTVIQSGAERIAMQRFVPGSARDGSNTRDDAIDRGYAIVCHGYYDHVGLYGYLIDYLVRSGLTVITFDEPGHGLSSGAPATIDSFDRYVETTRAVVQQAIEHGWLPAEYPLHWFGQSMGGAVVMEYLVRYPTSPIGEVVLFAPLVRPYAWWINRWVFAVAKRTITERPRVIAPNADNQEFYTLQLKDPLQAHVLPVAWVQAMVDWYRRFDDYPPSDLAPKIIQGYADRTVSWRRGYKTLAQRYPNAQWLLLPGGQHHLVNESAEMRQQMWTWLD